VFPPQAWQTLNSASGLYHLEIRTSPQPAIKGDNWGEYRITDESGAPATGLSVAVRPWMPAHAHGTSVQPTVVESDQGVYTIQNLLFFMAGHWELRTTIGSSSEDVVVPVFDVN
jgi:hypothetical protein